MTTNLTWLAGRTCPRLSPHHRQQQSVQEMLGLELSHCYLSQASTCHGWSSAHRHCQNQNINFTANTLSNTIFAILSPTPMLHSVTTGRGSTYTHATFFTQLPVHPTIYIPPPHQHPHLLHSQNPHQTCHSEPSPFPVPQLWNSILLHKDDLPRFLFLSHNWNLAFLNYCNTYSSAFTTSHRHCCL